MAWIPVTTRTARRDVKVETRLRGNSGMGMLRPLQTCCALNPVLMSVADRALG